MLPILNRHWMFLGASLHVLHKAISNKFRILILLVWFLLKTKFSVMKCCCHCSMKKTTWSCINLIWTFIKYNKSILFNRCWYEENSLQWIMYGPIVVSICVSKYFVYRIVVSHQWYNDCWYIYCWFARHSGERAKTSWLGIRIVCGATCLFPHMIYIAYTCLCGVQQQSVTHWSVIVKIQCLFSEISCIMRRFRALVYCRYNSQQFLFYRNYDLILGHLNQNIYIYISRKQCYYQNILKLTSFHIII